MKRIPGKQQEIVSWSGVKRDEELHTLLNGTCMIRRRKNEVLAQLPPKLRTKLVLDRGKCDSRKLAELRKQMRALMKMMRAAENVESRGAAQGRVI